MAWNKCVDKWWFYSGYSFNLDGGTIYMSLGAIFCAQAGGMSLPIATQLSIMGTLMLTSKGIAAVPRGSMIIMAGTISQVKQTMLYKEREKDILTLMGVIV